ncbi:MAG: carboxypeptidase-like regulatory domain-containing protein, partial [bacterium]|nr:carboxypeptidase-like regulatory domain-containing protein [bacterium]
MNKINRIKIAASFVFALALFAGLPQAMAQDSSSQSGGRLFDFIIPPEPSRIELLAANIGVPVSIVLSAAGAGALVMAASAGSASTAFNLSRAFQSLKLMRFYLLGLVRLRKKKPWGKVIDKLTGRPVPLAMVRIYSSEFNKLLDAHLTDIGGRFDALVLPGSYDVLVSKKGYREFRKDGVKISSEGQV